MPTFDVSIDPATSSEALRWKCAFLTYPPERPDGPNTLHMIMGFRLREVQTGDDSMVAHWQDAAACWHASGYTPELFLVLHQTLADLLQDPGLSELLDADRVARLGIGDGIRNPGTGRLGWHRGALSPHDWAGIPTRLYTTRFSELVLGVLLDR